jgi:hypothetical protein
MHGLFQPLEVYVGPSILTVGALCFFFFWDYMLEFSSESASVPFVPLWYGFQNVIIRLKVFSSSLILVFLVWALLVLPVTLLKNSITTVSVFASCLPLLTASVV